MQRKNESGGGAEPAGMAPAYYVSVSTSSYGVAPACAYHIIHSFARATHVSRRAKKNENSSY